MYCAHRYLHVPTTSFPSRRPSELDGTSVADMRRVVDRRAADIHGDARGAFALGHDLFSMGLHVVETKRTGHALYPRNLARRTPWGLRGRSEEHTSELQSLMRISYAVFCLKNKNITPTQQTR